MRGNRFHFEGRAARRGNAPVSDNPHPAGSEAHRSWAEGWREIDDGLREGITGALPDAAPTAVAMDIRTGPLSAEDTETLVVMWKAGETPEAIGRAIRRYADEVQRLVMQLRDRFDLPSRQHGTAWRQPGHKRRSAQPGPTRRSNGKQAYSEAENDLIWRLAMREGKTNDQIAEAASALSGWPRTPGAIQAQLTRLRKERGPDPDALYRGRIQTRWSEERNALLIKLWNAGMEMADMEVPLNATSEAIKTQVKKLREAGCKSLPYRPKGRRARAA